MRDTGMVSLNTLNHNSGEGILEFSFQGTQGAQLVTLTGRVPLIMPAEGDIRQVAKDTVRQLLQEAIDALDT